MEVVSISSGIVDETRPRQGIKDLTNAGFRGLLLDYRRWHRIGQVMELPEDDRQAEGTSAPLMEGMASFMECARQSGMTFPIAAAYSLPWDYKYRKYKGNEKNTAEIDTRKKDAGGVSMEELRKKLEEFAEEDIRLCAKAGCTQIIVRPVLLGLQREELWKYNREFYLRLAETAIEEGIGILLENQCRNINGHLVRGLFSDERKAAEQIDELNLAAGREVFGFCMNVGSCNLCGQNMYDFATVLGDRIKAVILRDCDGDKNNAMLSFTCVNRGSSCTDWLNLIRGLRRIEFDGTLVLDYMDTAAAFSPMLKPQLLKLAFSVGDYFKWQIGMENTLKKYPKRVLFGAGNMCRNYMKDYGEQFPPLFTCDNNRTLWGTQFEGLSVKSPESLKELPADTAIFICNIYYREIEEQLRSMGVCNPIEYFNDEYMNTFYFERL